MKTRSELQELIELLRKCSRRCAKAQTAMTDAEAAAAKLRETITNIGEPDYTDDAAIGSLALAKTKLDLCEQAIGKRSQELSELTRGDCYEVCTTIGGAVESILLEEAKRRANEIADVIGQFCCDRKLATALASATDAVSGALDKAQGVRARSVSARDSQDIGRIMSFLAEAESVLSEAIKERPNLKRFLAVDLSPAGINPNAVTGAALASVRLRDL